MADYNTIPANAGSRTAAIDAGLRAHMNKVYSTMSVGMVITAVAAWAIAGLATTTDANLAAAQLPNGKLLTNFGLMIYGTWLKYVIMLAPLAVLFLGMGAVMRRASAAGAQLFFFVFATLIGLSLSSIFIRYTGHSNLLGHSHSFRRLVTIWLYNKERYLRLGQLFDHGRNWFGCGDDRQHLLAISSLALRNLSHWRFGIRRPHSL